MASQRDPQNLKNRTKSAKWHPRTPFESSFGRFHFRKGFQVVPKDLQNLKNHSLTKVKPLFSENLPALKLVSFGHLLGSLLVPFPLPWLPDGAQSCKKDPFKKHKKNYQILSTKLTPKRPPKWGDSFDILGFWIDSGPHSAPDPPQTPIFVTFWSYF